MNIKFANYLCELNAYVNATPKLQSLLYDLDLLPEQLKNDSNDWYKMLTIVRWYRNKYEVKP